MNKQTTPLHRQVGGNHYTSKIQHATFCQQNRIPWCEAAAIKYIVRHRLKNGKEDLLKAKHYLEICCYEEYIRKDTNPIGMDPEVFPIPLKDFMDANGLTPLESQVVVLICSHQRKHGESTLRNAITLLDSAIAEYEREAAQAQLDLGLL